ncbi:MAG: site-specific integrase [Acidobacteria bacterium]|nr:site-specific integrase [Acidobacteriota bacterium]
MDFRSRRRIPGRTAPLPCQQRRQNYSKANDRSSRNEGPSNQGASCRRRELSPHDLRRSFVSDLLDNGADLSLAQQLAGHASPKTTARYDRRPEVAKARCKSLACSRFADN